MRDGLTLTLQVDAPTNTLSLGWLYSLYSPVGFLPSAAEVEAGK